MDKMDREWTPLDQDQKGVQGETPRKFHVESSKTGRSHAHWVGESHLHPPLPFHPLPHSPCGHPLSGERDSFSGLTSGPLNSSRSLGKWGCRGFTGLLSSSFFSSVVGVGSSSVGALNVRSPLTSMGDFFRARLSCLARAAGSDSGRYWPGNGRPRMTRIQSWSVHQERARAARAKGVVLLSEHALNVRR